MSSDLPTLLLRPPARPLRGLLAVALAVLAVLAAAAFADRAAAAKPAARTAFSGGAAAATPAAPAKPTVVLVHGAWAGSASWDGVVARLQRKGYRVVAPPTPLRGLATDVPHLAGFLSTIPGPVVLAGHSYGGAIVTGAATANANVKALVYVDAFIPDEGDSLQGLLAIAPTSAFAADPRTLFDFAPFPGAAEGVVDLYVKPAVYQRAFAPDLPRRTTAVLAATQSPLALNALAEPAGPPAWKTRPSWAVVGTEDRIIPASAQLKMARAAGAKVTKVKASHASLVSQPAAVSRVIERAAASVR